MPDDLDDVLALKASAKSARADKDWANAIEDLEEAVQLLRQDWPDAATRHRNVLASELADSYGMLGGIHRRWGLSQMGADRQHHLKESTANYDQGFLYEKSLDASDASTYNRINRLVSRVLQDPNVLLADDPTGLDVKHELEQAEEIVIEQLESVRRKDPWAHCDLGVIHLLLGRPGALHSFHAIDRLHPKPFVYESILDTLEPLSAVASKLRPELAEAVRIVRNSARVRGFETLDR